MIQLVWRIPGSPPLTRGTLHGRREEHIRNGITPAHAGNTSSPPSLCSTPWDHPRSRGEHSYLISKPYHNKGSPPPTRGTLHSFITISSGYGITPAYAGNTIPLLDIRQRLRDHPRLRGEHLNISPSPVRSQGSPPPTRGTLGTHAAVITFTGITPAYAGNTLSLSLLVAYVGDHPRLRGEHSNGQNPPASVRGSPPPTRGTPSD